MKLRVAFMGFRHSHIMGAYNGLLKKDEVEIVAACEEHAETMAALKGAGKVDFTHDNFDTMLQEVKFDILATGDYYGRRGSILIEGLKRGKHGFSDKPICTSLDEIDRIEKLSKKKHLAIGCQLDLRSFGIMRALRRLIRAGEIGEIHAISFGGQHPLNYGTTRPGWYFEKGKHGGTINDIAIHAFDIIPWLTGLRFVRVDAARNWNARLKEVPYFKDAAQVMLTMDNGCGVLGDVSYLLPEKVGYKHPLGWRFTFWGAKGVLEATLEKALIYGSGEKEVRVLQPDEKAGDSCLESFLREVRGESLPDDLVTAEVIRASRHTLLAQKAADEGRHDLALD